MKSTDDSLKSMWEIPLEELEQLNILRAENKWLRTLPHGFEAEKVLVDGVNGYHVKTPRHNGVRGNSCVWEDSEDPADQMLYLILEKMVGQG